MIVVRIAKVLMIAAVAAFALIVAYDNIADYDSNYQFVQHVLSMDTTFPGNALIYRRITSPALWQAGYALIILGEGLTGIALAAATIILARRLRSDGACFNHAKRFMIIGAALGSIMPIIMIHHIASSRRRSRASLGGMTMVWSIAAICRASSIR